MREPGEALVLLGTSRNGRADFVGRLEIGGTQSGLVNLHVPLKVRILMHVVGPGRSLEFEAADNGDYFLAIWHAEARLRRRDGDGFCGRRSSLR